MKNLPLLGSFLWMGLVNAQDSAKKNPITVSGFVEAYYCYDMAEPKDHARDFFYNYNRHNEVNLNLGFIKGSYVGGNSRANLALMAGTYSQYNLSGEPLALQHIYEANAGVKLSPKKNIWLDAGVLPSHIGFESAVGKDCWTLTRSLCAENSPYYESGVRLSYTSMNAKFFLAGFYLNGWQRIARSFGSQSPCFGTQVTYTPSRNFLLNWSTFIGTNTTGSERGRYFNNFYGVWQISEKFGLTGGLDFGLEGSYSASFFYTWCSPVIIARYSPSEKIRIAARAEYYGDPNSIIVSTGTFFGFETAGYSVNLDYLPAENVVLRFEARGLNAGRRIFGLQNQPSAQNYFFTTSLSVAF
jgi:hypothetical protein